MNSSRIRWCLLRFDYHLARGGVWTSHSRAKLLEYKKPKYPFLIKKESIWGGQKDEIPSFTEFDPCLIRRMTIYFFRSLYFRCSYPRGLIRRIAPPADFIRTPCPFTISPIQLTVTPANKPDDKTFFACAFDNVINNS